MNNQFGFFRPPAFSLLAVLFIAACSTTTDVPPVEIDSTPSKDGAPSVERDVSKIPDAVPQKVKRTRAGNKSPYTVFQKTYTLLEDSKDYKEKGYASWYGTKFHGRNTANGEIYDMWGMTAAHKTLPIPSYVRVTNVHNNKTVIVRVNDRGPFHSDRIIDLSYAAAKKLGFAESGVALVDVEDVTPMNLQVEELPQQVEPKVIAVKVKPVSPTISKVVEKSKSPDLVRQPSGAHNNLAKPVTWQVGAFKNKSSADKLRAQLNAILDAPVSVVASSTQWHRVRVGPITDKKTLEETRQRLSKQGITALYPVK